MRLAERISGSALPSLQVTYLKRCKSRAVKIIKDSTHPGNHLFRLLPSGKRFRSMMAKKDWKTEEELLPSGHQAPKHKPSLIITYKIVTGNTSILSSSVFFCVHTLNNPSAHPFYSYHYLLNLSTLFFLHILLFCTSYCFALFVLHILLLFLFFLPYICSCVVVTNPASVAPPITTRGRHHRSTNQFFRTSFPMTPYLRLITCTGADY